MYVRLHGNSRHCSSRSGHRLKLRTLLQQGPAPGDRYYAGKQRKTRENHPPQEIPGPAQETTLWLGGQVKRKTLLRHGSILRYPTEPAGGQEQARVQGYR